MTRKDMIVEFIGSYQEEHGKTPVQRVIASNVGISIMHLNRLLHALEEEKRIVRMPFSIKITGY